MAHSDDLTLLIQAARDGGECERERLYNAVYEELKIIARGVYGVGRPGETMQATVLTSELFLEIERRFPSPPKDIPESRRTFFRSVALSMRTIVRDYAVAKGAAKRGGSRKQFELMESVIQQHAQRNTEVADLLSLDEALDELERFNPRWAEVILHRFYAGRGLTETAELMGIARSTVAQDWALAKAWLEKHMSPDIN